MLYTEQQARGEKTQLKSPVCELQLGLIGTSAAMCVGSALLMGFVLWAPPCPPGLGGTSALNL